MHICPIQIFNVYFYLIQVVSNCRRIVNIFLWLIRKMSLEFALKRYNNSIVGNYFKIEFSVYYKLLLFVKWGLTCQKIVKINLVFHILYENIRSSFKISIHLELKFFKINNFPTHVRKNDVSSTVRLLAFVLCAKIGI